MDMFICDTSIFSLVSILPDIQLFYEKLTHPPFDMFHVKQVEYRKNPAP
jgi:hypothetical protein